MSKRIVTFTLLLAAVSFNAKSQTAAQGTTASTAPVNVMLADGTPVKLRLGSSAASAVRVGQDLELEVAEDVRIGDVIVIPKGGPANASVTNLRAGSNSGHGGWVDINLDSVTLADGKKVPIRASKNKPFRDDQSTIVSSSGQDASIAQGTDLTTYINGNQAIDLTRIRAASGPTTEVSITSVPANAEISVDGRDSGSTPRTFRMPAGDHVVIVRMAGFQPWQTKLHVAGVPVTLDVPLAKLDGTEKAPAAKATEPSLGDLARAARARKMQSANPPAPKPARSSNASEPRDPMVPPSTQNQ
jgi:hypothetical protein